MILKCLKVLLSQDFRNVTQKLTLCSSAKGLWIGGQSFWISLMTWFARKSVNYLGSTQLSFEGLIPSDLQVSKRS